MESGNLKVKNLMTDESKYEIGKKDIQEEAQRLN